MSEWVYCLLPYVRANLDNLDWDILVGWYDWFLIVASSTKKLTSNRFVSVDVWHLAFTTNEGWGGTVLSDTVQYIIWASFCRRLTHSLNKMRVPHPMLLSDVRVSVMWSNKSTRYIWFDLIWFDLMQFQTTSFHSARRKTTERLRDDALTNQSVVGVRLIQWTTVGDHTFVINYSWGSHVTNYRWG